MTAVLDYKFKPELVILSLVLACTGCYSAFDAYAIARKKKMGSTSRRIWLGLSAFYLGCVSIFAMHFVAVCC